MIYSAVNHQKLSFSDLTHPPLWWRNSWMVPMDVFVEYWSFLRASKQWIHIAIQDFFYFQLYGKYKVENILEGSLDLIPLPSPSGKIQIMGKIFAWGVKAKHCFWKQQQCFALLPQINFPPIIWRKLKVMESNLLKSFLL